jgi:hypothetical protein
LKRISALCRISGIVCFIGALIPLFAILVFNFAVGTSAALWIFTFFAWSAGLVMAGLINYRFGELICLFIDIESNSRLNGEARQNRATERAMFTV